MLIKITNVNTPWPLGSIVDVPYDAIPSWLHGKCTPADEGAKAAHVMELPSVPPPSAAPGAQVLGDGAKVKK